jgi:myo-inositol-1(or 4)-monophosphatase
MMAGTADGLVAVSRDAGHWLGVAVDAARAAGELLAGTGGRERSSVQHVGRDIKLGADRESETLVIDLLRARSPFAILSEEAGAVAGEGEFSWVVDPLDGTANYWRGIPFCCVAIALVEGDNPIAGVIYDFNRDEMFSGIVGAGAWMNGKDIHVGSTTTATEAVLCTGFPTATDFSPDALSGLITSIRAFKKVRFLGSAALSLAYVGCGRADAYYERDIRLWDVAAGLAIVRAAGGYVSPSPSDAAPHAMTVFASAPGLAGTMA